MVEVEIVGVAEEERGGGGSLQTEHLGSVDWKRVLTESAVDGDDGGHGDRIGGEGISIYGGQASSHVKEENARA